LHWVIPPTRSGLLKVPAMLLWQLGWTSLNLFFVLSGFLVGGLLMRELRNAGALDLRGFLIGRALKFWPTRWVA
jgi:peptidoglycan/LPS O-acetylase OafA/YrhL